MLDFDSELNFLRKYHSEQCVHNGSYYRTVYFTIRFFCQFAYESSLLEICLISNTVLKINIL